MRLIDADDAKRYIWREWMSSKTVGEKELCDILEKIIVRCCEHIDNAPTVDTVEVVPCKDCKYWGDEEFAEGGYRVCECPNKDYATTDPKNHAYFPLCLEDDFCSYGKR